MNDTSRNPNRDGESLERFILFIVITIAGSFVPWFNTAVDILWLRILIGLIFVFITLKGAKVLTKYGVKHGMDREYKIFPYYVVYISIYLLVKYL